MQTPGKTFAGPGVMAARQEPSRTREVLSKGMGCGNSPLFSAVKGSPKYLVLSFFVLSRT